MPLPRFAFLLLLALASARRSERNPHGRARGKRFVALAGEDRIVYDADPSAVSEEPRHLQRKASLAEPS